MTEIDFMSVLHKSTKRDYLKRVNDKEYPKAKAAELAKKWDFDYWDGDRRVNYGGYSYIEGRWEKVAQKFIDYYKLGESPKTIFNYGGLGAYSIKNTKFKSSIYEIRRGDL